MAKLPDNARRGKEAAIEAAAKRAARAVVEARTAGASDGEMWRLERAADAAVSRLAALPMRGRPRREHSDTELVERSEAATVEPQVEAQRPRLPRGALAEPGAELAAFLSWAERLLEHAVLREPRLVAPLLRARLAVPGGLLDRLAALGVVLDLPAGFDTALLAYVETVRGDSWVEAPDAPAPKRRRGRQAKALARRVRYHGRDLHAWRLERRALCRAVASHALRLCGLRSDFGRELLDTTRKAERARRARVVAELRADPEFGPLLRSATKRKR